MKNSKIEKNIGKKLQFFFKAFKLQIYLFKKKLNILKQSNKYYKKPKEKVCFLLLCDLSKLIFQLFLKKI